MEVALFLTAGLVGGVVNALAGGAKLFVFPMLLASGLPPLVANATGTAGVWPAQLPAAFVYRDELSRDRKRMVRRLIPALIGSLVGALLLVNSSEAAFLTVIPVLLVLSVAAIALGKQLPRLVRRLMPERHIAAMTGLLLFLCGVYGGYFGAGMGFILLAIFTLADAQAVQFANARKNLFGVAINTIAIIPLTVSGLIDWTAAPAIVAGGLVGGYAGGRLTRVLPEGLTRILVATIGLVLTLTFLAR